MKQNFDVIISGGGAAGIMAAITAKRTHPGLSVAILDRTFALGRKILVCGAGRCNITNINLNESIEKHYYTNNPGFPNEVFKSFGFNEIKSFFNELGIDLYVERKTNIGKLFPVTDQAKTVTTLLEDELNRLGVEIFLRHEVKNVKKNVNFQIIVDRIGEDEKIIESDLIFESKYLILSAGGKTYPALGSNGSGYSIAENLGHKLVKPVPSALPLVSKNPLSQELQGVKFEIEVTSYIDGQKIKTRSDDVMFTQYGFSGPAILNVSREISIQINRFNKFNCELSLNFFPGKSRLEVQQLLDDRWNRRPDQTIEMSLIGLFPAKFPIAMLKLLHIDKNKRVESLSNQEKNDLVNFLTDFRAEITATRGWNEAEFTAGGIDTVDVDNQTLESKIVENLYFCGEILDVDGDVGGFNLSWAWASGFTAGRLLQV